MLFILEVWKVDLIKKGLEGLPGEGNQLPGWQNLVGSLSFQQTDKLTNLQTNQ